MSDIPPLSIAFINQRPSAAAKVLEGLAVDDAAALINALPGHVSGLALGHMMPLTAAQCLAPLDPERVAHIIRDMMFLEAASILRVMDENIRSSVMAALPSDLSRDFSKSLNHPRDSVGAWMDQKISPLPLTRTASDALKYAKRKRRPKGDELFVVDDSRQYVGVLKISDLVQYDGKTVLKDIVKGDAPSLSNRASLASVVNISDWDHHHCIAVVGRKGNFLGSLTRNQARAGIDASRRSPNALEANSILTHLLQGLFVTLTGLLNLLLHSTDVVPAQSGKEVQNDR